MMWTQSAPVQQRGIELGPVTPTCLRVHCALGAREYVHVTVNNSQFQVESKMPFETIVGVFGTIVFYKGIEIVNRVNILEFCKPVAINVATYLVSEIR